MRYRIIAEAKSNASQRSRSTIASHPNFVRQLNQSPVTPVTWSPVRQKIMSASGSASGTQPIPARVQAVSQCCTPRPGILSCCRIISAEKARTPSTPQPKVWQSHRRHDSGTNRAVRRRVRPSRPSRSHSANRLSASPIASAKFTKPNWMG